MAKKQNEQEPVVEVSKMEQFIVNHGKKIIYGAVALIVVVAGAMLVNSFSSDRENKALESEALMQGQFSFEQGQYEAALEDFQSVISEYGSTTAGNLAKAYAGLCQKELGNCAEAIALLKDYDGSSRLLAPAVYSALGDCQVEAENADYLAAAKNFEKAATLSSSIEFSPIFLKKAGLAYEKAGDNAKALKAYETIKNTWPESEIGRSIDKYIVRVQ